MTHCPKCKSTKLRRTLIRLGDRNGIECLNCGYGFWDSNLQSTEITFGENGTEFHSILTEGEYDEIKSLEVKPIQKAFSQTQGQPDREFIL